MHLTTEPRSEDRIEAVIGADINEKARAPILFNEGADQVKVGRIVVGVSSMGFQSQMSSTVAGGTRPTVLCQDDPASKAKRLVLAMQSLPLGAAHAAMLPCASLWAAACCMWSGVWPRGGVWPRERRVEGRRRPKKTEVADVAPLLGARLGEIRPNKSPSELL